MSFTNLSISNKIGLSCAVLILLASLSSVVGIFTMNKIGNEIEEIAEQDIPLAELITKITVHQLEQAILFERGLRLGIQLKDHPETADHHADVVARFEKLAHQVDEEVKVAEDLLQSFIINAHSDLAQKEFKNLFEQMKLIDQHHQEYEAQALDILEKIKLGWSDALALEVETTEALEDKVDHELETALSEIEAFTAQAAQHAEEDEHTGMTLMIGALILMIIIGGISTRLISRAIARPIIGLSKVMTVMAEGQREIEVPGVNTGDETGDMARSVDVFRLGLIEADRLAEVQRKQDEEKIKRADKIDLLNQNFEEGAGEALSVVAAAAEELQATASSMSVTATQTGSQALTVAAASEQASANVQTVAVASEELSVSIQEISRQITHSAERVGDAIELVANADKQVAGLAIAAGNINDVIELINDIAEQTNLLALNATIEAARAGEAGKGFAVVASEVKNLANQTQRATQEIEKQIETVQTETNSAVTAIHDIGNAISKINEVSQSIAGAAEEQDAATNEITRNVEQAAEGTRDVSSNIQAVSEGAGETGSASSQVLSSAGELSSRASHLQDLIQTYLTDVKAA